jgi:hypothetical protein
LRLKPLIARARRSRKRTYFLVCPKSKNSPRIPVSFVASTAVVEDN